MPPCEARIEAITSRALLLAAVGRATQHAGKTTLYLTTMHAAKASLMLLIANTGDEDEEKEQAGQGRENGEAGAVEFDALCDGERKVEKD